MTPLANSFRPMIRHLGVMKHRRVLLLTVLAGGIAGLLIATNLSIGPFNAHRLFTHVPQVPLLLCAILLITNEVLKGIRWGMYLQAGGVRVGMWDAICTHIASQAVNVIPGNDWLAARLVEEHQQGTRHPKMRQAAPAIVARWVCDCFALSLIVTVGVWYYRGFSAYTLLPIPVGLGIVALFRAKAPARWIARQLGRWSRTRQLVRSEADFHRAARRIMRPRVLLTGMALSTTTTALSALALYVLAWGFGARGFGVAEAMVTHALATLASMVSFIPNGFGVADGSLAGWMHHFHVSTRQIVLTTLTLRLTNIVVRSAAGIAMLLARYRFMWTGGARQFVRRIVRGEVSLAPAPASASRALTVGHTPANP